ncbi:MAG: hypothetical protein JW995_05105 [Melioribacteraceae bacterium]|nr:hypothetical protein [Melioribacteraceae bacterium]
MVKKKIKPTLKKVESPFKNYWEKLNYITFGTGFIILVLGYYLMTQGPWDNVLSLSVSPVVLIFAYLVIFPLAIFIKKKKSN